jgi:hypothetical protein
LATMPSTSCSAHTLSTLATEPCNWVPRSTPSRAARAVREARAEFVPQRRGAPKRSHSRGLRRRPVRHRARPARPTSSASAPSSGSRPVRSCPRRVHTRTSSSTANNHSPPVERRVDYPAPGAVADRVDAALDGDRPRGVVTLSVAGIARRVSGFTTAE